MALSVMARPGARPYSVRAPTADSQRTAATLKVSRTVNVVASAEPVQSVELKSRRDVAKSVLLGAPLVAGLVPSASLAYGEGPPAVLQQPSDLDKFLKDLKETFAPDSTGIGSDGINAFAIFKYIVPAEQERPFVKAFAVVKKQALNANPPIPGIVDFTFFKEAPTPIKSPLPVPLPSPAPTPPPALTYFSTAIFKTEQQGRDFIATQVGQDFIKQILGLGVKFLPNGAVFAG